LSSNFIEEAIFLSERIYMSSSHPVTVKQELQIDLPKDSTEQIRLHPTFLKYKNEVMRLLRTPELV